ncbi:hypothetical protein PMI40_02916 [Herbaspirillum sp. YR522]|nr:hypothetical protein PMI40_02916 [Herbaspirillum sp. YR522]
MQRGRDDAIETINATDDASANLSNVSIFTNLIKKAEDGAQSAL